MNPYPYTIPLFVKLLGGLNNILKKSADYARAHGSSEEDFLKDALAPDMFPFVRQVQIACDNAKGAAARLSGQEPPKFADDEKSFSDLEARIDKTVDYLKTFNEQSFVSAHERKITLPYFPGKYMNGSEYALEYAVPNFLFHVTVAYAIARKNGVPLGKADFINGLPLRDL